MGLDKLIAVEILQCSVAFVFFLKTFTKANIKLGYYIFLIMSVAISVLCKSIWIYDIVVTLVSIFVYIFLPLFTVSKIQNKEKVYISLLVVGIISLINSCASYVAFVMNLSGIVNNITAFIIRLSAMVLLLIIMNNSRIKALTMDLMSVSRNIKIVLLIFVWELFFLNNLQNTILSRNLGIRINLTIGSAIFITAVVSCVVIHLLISNNLRSSYYKKINATMEEKVHQQVRHYQQMSKANENLRKFRHDFNNMLIGLDSCLKDGNLDKARAYLSRLAELAEKDNVKIHSGDSLVDSLIADKVNGAGEHNVEIEFEGLIPVDVMDPVDLCIVFGNALDNAA